MHSSLTRKLILGYALFALLSILFINLWSYNKIYKIQVNKSANELYNEGVLTIGKYITVDDTIQFKNNNLTTYLDTTANLTQCNIWIINAGRSIVYDSSNKYLDTKIYAFTEKSFNSRHYTIGYFYGIFDNSVLTVEVPIKSGNTTVGYMLLHKNMSLIYDECNDQTYVIYLTFIAVFAFSLIILILCTIIIFIPLGKITAASKEFAKGNFTYNGLEKFRSGEDEIGELGVSLNYMAGKLNDMENDERKFVSNVSHDFRSPLTSIKGYIEAIKDGTIPYEMQDKYLDIVLFETDRLTKLTQNLLTLGTWDSNAGHLILTDFKLNDLIIPIINSLNGKAEKKRVQINLNTDSKDYYVNADRDKIQQVIYNLLDNAIKFSNNDSKIDINITNKNDRIFISVKDYGIGIPKESVSKVWDRFYKTDLSRGKDKTGTGLGLSIVKEIVKAHNQNINCISTEGVGTEFVFTLQKGKK